MPDTRVIDEPIVVTTLVPQDTFYVAHWAGSFFEDAQVSFDTLATSVAVAITNKEINEAPAGTINGINVDFLLSQTPSGNSLTVYKNGLLQKMEDDFTVVNKTISFVAGAVPLPGDKITAIYHT